MERHAPHAKLRPGAQHRFPPGQRPPRLRVETGEAKAMIVATQALRTLDITVQRFREERVLSDGPCHSVHEIDQRLRSLCTDLSASPFA